MRQLPLPGGFPHPTPADLDLTAAQLSAVPAQTSLLIDGLAFGALPASCIATIQAPIVALVHHPLCLETGLPLDLARHFRETERHALAHATSVIATSPTTAAWLADHFAVPSDRLAVAPPGTQRAAKAPRIGNPPRLLAVGAVSRRKAYDQLIDALSGLSHRAWTLSIAGDLDRDPTATALLKAAIDRHHLSHRVTLTGRIPADDLAMHYQQADIFVSASQFEGYGMAIADALSHGLPLVAVAGGAVAETIAADAALLCPPGDPVALRDALARMISDPATRDACAAASWARGQTLPRWDHTAAIIAEILARTAR